MFRALVWKELRGAWPIALVGLGLQAIFAWAFWKTSAYSSIGLFRDDETLIVLGSFSMGTGVLLALWMTLPETIVGTSSLLVHLVRSRGRVVSAKVMAGLMLWGITSIPILIVLAVVFASGRTPFDLVHARYFLVILASGIAAFLAMLAAGLRGFPWKEGWAQLGGICAAAVGIWVTLALPWFGGAVLALAVTTAFCLAWAFTGLSVREF